MHDHLRDLAYGIVREESSRAANRTRLLGRDAENSLKHGVRACQLAVLCVGSLRQAAAVEGHDNLWVPGVIFFWRRAS